MNFRRPIKTYVIAFLCIFTLCVSELSAQDNKQCEEIVELIIESFNQSSTAEFKTHLSDDFSFAGQKSPIASLVLDQLFLQLDDEILTKEKLNESKKDGILEINYSLTYKSMGIKEANFIFNSSNEVTEFSLLSMQVKTMDADADVSGSVENVIEIPFTRAGNLILVQVFLNGEERNFILDSGSPKVIINSNHYKTDDSDKKKLSTVKGVGGSISNMDITRIDEVDLYGIKLNDQDLLSMDLTHLEASLGTEFHGLIGYEILKDYDILYDYERQVVTLIKPAYFEEFLKSNTISKDIQRFPLKMEGHIPTIELKIGKRSFTLGIDSGAETNLISSTYYNSLTSQLTAISQDSLSGADTSVQLVNKGRLKTMKMGKMKFKNMETIFSDISHLNTAYKIKIDGLVGFELLSKQPTLISFQRKEIIFFE